ncbi:MAG: hypothetical protein V7K89_27570 [Nostoc sp.]|uniref:hypothetical protein n=1 Tax=Nostoc sp. TaxID=1180 RepID=UPI002FF56164
MIDAPDADDSGEIVKEVKAASKKLYAEEYRAIAQSAVPEAIADSEDISDAQLKKLQNQRAKTPAERHQQHKAELSHGYEVNSYTNSLK